MYRLACDRMPRKDALFEERQIKSTSKNQRQIRKNININYIYQKKEIITKIGIFTAGNLVANNLDIGAVIKTIFIIFYLKIWLN